VALNRTAPPTLGPGPVLDATAAQLAQGAGRLLPPNPVTERLATAATAWAGQELIVWGGVSRDRVVHGRILIGYPRRRPGRASLAVDQDKKRYLVVIHPGHSGLSARQILDRSLGRTR
jgi:hypothetical protein